MTNSLTLCLPLWVICQVRAHTHITHNTYTFSKNFHTFRKICIILISKDTLNSQNIQVIVFLKVLEQQIRILE